MNEINNKARDPVNHLFEEVTIVTTLQVAFLAPRNICGEKVNSAQAGNIQ
jgi:hypothetical protein